MHSVYVYIIKLYNTFHIFKTNLYSFLLQLNFVSFSDIKFWADIFIEPHTTLLLIGYSSFQSYQTKLFSKLHWIIWYVEITYWYSVMSHHFEVSYIAVMSLLQTVIHIIISMCTSPFRTGTAHIWLTLSQAGAHY